MQSAVFFPVFVWAIEVETGQVAWFNAAQIEWGKPDPKDARIVTVMSPRGNTTRVFRAHLDQQLQRLMPSGSSFNPGAAG